jgi:uncharacterized ubiquitin-like protein YukD
MKITIKTLQQTHFQLDADKTDTVHQQTNRLSLLCIHYLFLQVLSVKKKIEESQKHAVSWQKLIYSGKILNDDAKLSEYNISENDFLVLMVRKVIIFICCCCCWLLLLVVVFWLLVVVVGQLLCCISFQSLFSLSLSL